MTLQAPVPRLVLASASPIRAALLRAAGLAFTVVPAAVDEARVRRAARAEDASAVTAALRLAELKAATVFERNLDAVVIGCDQILACDGQWFEKPPDLSAARAQLVGLRSRTHTLATAVACRLPEGRSWRHVSEPRLTMRPFSAEFLEAYLAREGEALTGTVGAYRLEGMGLHLFERVSGEHAAILGLPMLALLAFLRRHGMVLS